VPLSMSFDPVSGEFSFSFHDDPQHDVSDPTEILLPPSASDTVEISDGSYMLSGNQLLYFRGSAGTHEIHLLP
jgi:Glycoside hydrolase family 5 C-terminal domain